MSRNNELFAQAKHVLPGGNTRTTLFVPPSAPYAARGEGAHLIDEDDHELVDANNNYTALIHGHLFPPSMQAASAAISTGTSFGLPTKYEVEMAETLAERMPHLDQWRFSNSGTEAVMQALRIARAATGRDIVLRFQDSYHGTSDSVVDVSAPGIPRATAETSLVVPVGSLPDVMQAFEEHGRKIAAVLVDLMPNRAGLQPLDPTFTEALRKLTRENGALLIVDEVITFRINPGGMQARYGLEPDLSTLGKAIGGGFPVGAVGGKAEIMEVANPSRSESMAWGGTFTANPVTMAAGKAAIDAYDFQAVALLNKKGHSLRSRIQKAGVPCAGEGSLIRVFPKDSNLYWWAAYRKGVLLGTNCLVALSTAMTDNDIDTIEECLISAWEETQPFLR